MEVEIREEELMVSPLGGNPSLRIAHFLKPCSKCIKNPAHDNLPKTFFSETAISKPPKLHLELTFRGWPHPQEQWNTWEERIRSKYEQIWRNAGIHEAIKASTYQMQRSNDLVLGLAQKWYSKTNTFIFCWGEATITLEDIMICGGFSVVGSSVLTPLEDEESKQMEQKLDEVRRKLTKTKAKKAAHFPWLRHFLEEKGELEHAAFLSLWLARFVFLRGISKQIFPIAIHLARGTRIALAPAVLASIYRGLTLLKRNIGDAVKLKTSKPIILRAPFQLVQIWAFERFPSLHPKPNKTEYAQPVIAKWHKVKMLNYENVSLALDSARESFHWQPYKDSPKFYNEKDKWVCFNSDAHKDLESFARCLRHSELVGIDCIEKYLPHRVAMQFGLDQDIPGWVARCKEISPMIAWRNYDRPMTDTMLCIAAVASSSTLEPCVTSKYLEWWNQSKLGCGEKANKDSKSISISEKLSQASSQLGSHGQGGETGNSDQDDGSTVKELQKRSHGHETNVSMADGVENLAKSENLNVVGGSKRAKADAKVEDVIGKSKGAKEGKYGANGEEGEGVSDCTIDIYLSDYETRIGELERVVARLKAAKFGYKSGDFGAKAGLS